MKYCVIQAVAAVGPDYSDCYKTLREARKVLARAARESAQDCRQRYKRCSVVGTSRKGVIEIKIGGRQGYNMWSRYALVKR